MDENPGLSDRYRRASPWPVFVALGLVLGELGILFNVFPIAVGGLLLLSSSVAGMAAESGYVSTPWRALVACALVLVVLGAGLLYAEVQAGDALGQLNERGYAVLSAAAILLAGALVGGLLDREGGAPI